MLNTVQFPSPQILSGNVALGMGKTQTISLETMASRSHRWQRLDEMSVSFFIDPFSTGITSADAAAPMGSFINIRARAYRQDLMLNYVPTWLIGPRLQQLGEYTSTTGIKSNNQFLGAFETYRWKFPKPFYLPSGSAFSVQLQRNGGTKDQVYTTNINAHLTVRGMQVAENDAIQAMKNGRQNGNPIPFMASYVPTTFPNKSNNLDLANPFLIPLQLQRMTGRCVGTNTCQGVDTGNIATVKLSDTRIVTAEPTGMLTMFGSTQLAWTFTRVLDPGEYISAELATSNSAQSAPQVAIIGYRNEVMP